MAGLGAAKSNFADTTSSDLLPFPATLPLLENVRKYFSSYAEGRRPRGALFSARACQAAIVPYFSDNFHELFKHHRASANHEQRPI